MMNAINNFIDTLGPVKAGYSYPEGFRMLLLDIGVFLFFNNKRLQMETIS